MNDNGKRYFLISAGDSCLELKFDAEANSSHNYFSHANEVDESETEIIPYSSIYKIIKNDSSIEIILNDSQFTDHLFIMEGQLEALKLALSRLEKSLDELKEDVVNQKKKDFDKIRTEIRTVETAIHYIR